MKAGFEYEHFSPQVEYYRGRIAQEARLRIAFYQQDLRRSISDADNAYKTVVLPWWISFRRSEKFAQVFQLLDDRHSEWIPITDEIVQQGPFWQLDELRRASRSNELPFTDLAKFLVHQRNGAVTGDDVLEVACTASEKRSIFALGYGDGSWEGPSRKLLFGHVDSFGGLNPIPNSSAIPKEIIAFAQQIKSGRVAEIIHTSLSR